MLIVVTLAPSQREIVQPDMEFCLYCALISKMLKRLKYFTEVSGERLYAMSTVDHGMMVFPKVRRVEVAKPWGKKDTLRFLNVFATGDSIFNFTVKNHHEKTPAEQVKRRVVQAVIHDHNQGAMAATLIQQVERAIWKAVRYGDDEEHREDGDVVHDDDDDDGGGEEDERD